MSGGATRIAVCPLAALGRGEVRVVSLAEEVRPPREALVLRDQRGTPRAYLNRCQHLPIPLDASTREFLSEDGEHLLCSTHGARYRLEDGHCVEGPCVDERLEAIPLQVENGVVYLWPGELSDPRAR